MSYADDHLREIFDLQLRLQTRLYGADPASFREDQFADYVRMNVLAVTDELHEALAETGWKPWATSRHLNREAYKKELVDALHFFVNLCLVAGITAPELAAAYYEKNAKNHVRQDVGYDGVREKCPNCRRALDDVPVNQKFIYKHLGHLPRMFCSERCAVEWKPE